jgi:hypothetical protein
LKGCVISHRPHGQTGRQEDEAIRRGENRKGRGIGAHSVINFKVKEGQGMWHTWERSAYRVMVGNSEGKKPLGRPRM